MPKAGAQRVPYNHDCLEGLQSHPGVDTSDPAVRAFACLADEYLQPWTGIAGISSGMGWRGMITPGMLDSVASFSQVRGTGWRPTQGDGGRAIGPGDSRASSRCAVQHEL